MVPGTFFAITHPKIMVPGTFFCSIVKILNLDIILLCTHLYHTSFRYLSSACNAFIACYFRYKKYSGSGHFFSSLKKSCFFKSVLLVVFWIQWCSNFLNLLNFSRMFKNVYYSIFLSRCYYLVSKFRARLLEK